MTDKHNDITGNWGGIQPNLPYRSERMPYLASWVSERWPVLEWPPVLDIYGRDPTVSKRMPPTSCTDPWVYSVGFMFEGVWAEPQIEYLAEASFDEIIKAAPKNQQFALFWRYAPEAQHFPESIHKCYCRFGFMSISSAPRYMEPDDVRQQHA